MAKKGAMPIYANVDDYIANQKEEAKTLIQELRNIIKEAVPEAEELPNYKVPSFKLVNNKKSDQQIMIAAYAKFVSFYPFATTMEKFAQQLSEFKQGKGAVQFPFTASLPKDIIKAMVLYRKEELLKE